MNRTSKRLLPALAALIVTAIVVLTTSSPGAAKGHNTKAVKTAINLRTATQIGNTILPAGEYTVKISPASDTSGDPTVQVSMLSPPHADEIDYEEVVLTVQASLKKLDAATRLSLCSSLVIPTRPVD